MSIPEEQVKGIAHRTIREADEDGDKLISFDEFKEVGLNNHVHTIMLKASCITGSEEH